MTNVICFPPTMAEIKATQIPQAEFERLAELALDIVDRIILLLDEADSGPDFEPDADREPSLAAPLGRLSQVVWVASSDNDREVSALPPEVF